MLLLLLLLMDRFFLKQLYYNIITCISNLLPFIVICVNVQDIFDSLLTNMHGYQSVGKFVIYQRDMPDYIDGINNIIYRNVVDFNKHVIWRFCIECLNFVATHGKFVVVFRLYYCSLLTP
jgi:hypothetical protein